MREGLAIAGLGTGLFVSAMVGTLAVQGRLNSDGLRSLPVISWFAGAQLQAQDDQLPPPEPSVGKQPDRPTPKSREPEETGLFGFPKLDSGMTVSDLERILQQAYAVQAAAEQERALVAADKSTLEVRQRDIEDRETAIAQRMLEVERERERLDRRIAEFERQVLLVERDEVRALRDYGRSLAAFEPARAARIVEEEWQSETGKKRIVRVLALMGPTEADAILAAMPDARLRDVLLERMKVVLEPKDR
ncbi:MAG: hypothetical protein AB7I19_14620 [Planctomycetota bacterium]